MKGQAQAAWNASSIHRTLGSAAQQGLRDILRFGQAAPPVLDPRSPASGFGAKLRASRELLGYSFTLENPLGLWYFTDRSKPPRIPYYAGLLLWTLAGSDSAEWLSYYHPAATTFSPDGAHLCGGFGHRLLIAGGLDQIAAICDRIERDPGTRRALGTIATARDNSMEPSDYPCGIAVQFFLRDGLLHAVTFMRAQQALTILPFDVFLFGAIQCWIAARLCVRPGTYTHTCGTFHIYDDELVVAETIGNADLTSVSIGDIADFDRRQPELFRQEALLRQAAMANDTTSLRAAADSFEVQDSFSSRLHAILLVHALDRSGLLDRRNAVIEGFQGSFGEWLTAYYALNERAL